MQMQRVSLSQLTTKSKRVRVHIRVMRKWNYDGNTPGGPILYTGLVLADQQGTAMYAHIPGEVVPTKAPLIHVDASYMLSKFNVRPQRTSYVPFEAPLMIEFTTFTEVIPTDEPPSSFPMYIYNITHFSDIKTTPEAATKYIDVIGAITEVFPTKTVQIKSKERVAILREIIIMDKHDQKLTVTLWGDNATKFNLREVSPTAPASNIVALFVGCLPRSLFKKTQVSGGASCRWFLNPEIDEAQHFYNRFKTHPVEICEHPQEITDGDESIRPIILEHRNLTDLNSLDPYSFPEDGCKCTVTITEIPDDNTWWYMACDLCKKKVEFFSGKYYCGLCQWSEAKPRYKLSFVAKDDTAKARFFAHDNIARQMVRRNCSALINPLHHSTTFPKPLADMVSKTFTLAISLTEDSYRSMDARTYLVNSIIIHPDIQHLQLQASVHMHQQSTPLTQNQLTTVQIEPSSARCSTQGAPPLPSPWRPIEGTPSRSTPSPRSSPSHQIVHETVTSTTLATRDDSTEVSQNITAAKISLLPVQPEEQQLQTSPAGSSIEGTTPLLSPFRSTEGTPPKSTPSSSSPAIQRTMETTTTSTTVAATETSTKASHTILPVKRTLFSAKSEQEQGTTQAGTHETDNTMQPIKEGVHELAKKSTKRSKGAPSTNQ